MPEAIALDVFCYMSYFQLCFCHLRSNLRKINLPGICQCPVRIWFGDWESEGNSHTKNKVFKTSSDQLINYFVKERALYSKQIWELRSDHRNFLFLSSDNV